jgi:hypothetical protein
MGSQHPEGERHVDRDGVTRIEQPRTGSGSSWIIGLGLGFTALCLALSAWLVFAPSPVPEPVEPEPVAVRNTPAPTPLPARPRPVAQPTPPPAAPPGTPAPVREETVSQEAPEEVPAEEPAGEKTGLALFRPGTKPLKQGIIVPEDFELPQGYMRHYQTTDDGQRVKAILMFHPDYKPKDASGQPVELPANRVVPPEMAPPGLPIDILELPEGPEGVEPIP